MLFVGSYLAIWAAVGTVVYAVYRPHGSVAAGALVIAAGLYELTPLKRRFRRQCWESSSASGIGFGLCCVGSSIGLMVMMVALGVMSITWMAVIAVLVVAQKLWPPRAVIDVPLALAIVGLGFYHPCTVGEPRMHSSSRNRRQTMTEHKTGTREEWLAARLELLEAEKELTRRSDELARQRQELPWVRVDKEYRFETDEGTASLADLFRGRSQLLVYHFMFGPDYTAGCPSCSAIADGFNGSASTSPTTTSRCARCRGLRWRRYRPTSGGWAGASRGRRRSAATSTSTSGWRTPSSSGSGSRRVQLPRRGPAAAGRRGELAATPSRATAARTGRPTGVKAPA